MDEALVWELERKAERLSGLEGIAGPYMEVDNAALIEETVKHVCPLPSMTVGEPTGLYVVERADGCYLAIDSHSGGYPWWPDNIGSAEKFTANDRAVAYINTLSASERGAGIVVRQLMLGAPMSTAEFVDVANQDIRKTALAKLTAIERQALGLE